MSTQNPLEEFPVIVSEKGEKEKMIDKKDQGLDDDSESGTEILSEEEKSRILANDKKQLNDIRKDTGLGLDSNKSEKKFNGIYPTPDHMKRVARMKSKLR